METNALMQYPWLGGLLVFVVFCGCIAVGKAAATALRAGADKHYKYESLAGNPFVETDPRARNKALLKLLLLTGLVWLLLWHSAYRELHSTRATGPLGLPRGTVLQFLMGAGILTGLALLIRSMQSLQILKRAVRSEGLRGEIWLAQWLALELMAFNLLSTGAIYLVVLLVSPTPFFLGGALMCLLMGLVFLRKSARQRRATPQRLPVPPPPPARDATRDGS